MDADDMAASPSLRLNASTLHQMQMLGSGDFGDAMSPPDLVSPTGDNPTHTMSFGTVVQNATGPSSSANKMAAVRQKVSNITEFKDLERRRRRRIEHISLLVRMQAALRFLVQGTWVQEARDAGHAKRLYAFECSVEHQKLGAYNSYVSDGLFAQMEEFRRSIIDTAEASGRQELRAMSGLSALSVAAFDDKRFRFRLSLEDRAGIELQAAESMERLRRSGIVDDEAAERGALAARMPRDVRRQLQTDYWLDDVAATVLETTYRDLPQGSPSRALRTPQRQRSQRTGLTLQSSVAELLGAAGSLLVDGDAQSPGRRRMMTAALMAAVADAAVGDAEASVHTRAASGSLLLSLAGFEKQQLLADAAADLEAEHAIFRDALADLAAATGQKHGVLASAAARMVNTKRREQFDMEMAQAHTIASAQIHLSEAMGRERLVGEWRAVIGDRLLLDGCDPVIFANATMCDHCVLVSQAEQRLHRQRCLWRIEAVELAHRSRLIAEAPLPVETRIQADEVVSRLLLIDAARLDFAEIVARFEVEREERRGVKDIRESSIAKKLLVLRRDLMDRPLSPDTDLEAELGHHEERHRIELERSAIRGLRQTAVRMAKEWRVLVKVMLERRTVAEDSPLAGRRGAPAPDEIHI